MTKAEWKEASWETAKVAAVHQSEKMLLAAAACEAFAGEPVAWLCDECSNDACLHDPSVTQEEHTADGCGGTLRPLYAAPEVKP